MSFHIAAADPLPVHSPLPHTLTSNTCMQPNQVLGFGQRSLGYLLQRYCGIQADKSLGQRADWRQRCGRV